MLSASLNKTIPSFFPTDRIAHTTAFVIPGVEHWLEQEIPQWVHHEGSIRQPIAPRADALTTELHLSPFIINWININGAGLDFLVCVYLLFCSFLVLFLFLIDEQPLNISVIFFVFLFCLISLNFGLIYFFPFSETGNSPVSEDQ